MLLPQRFGNQHPVISFSYVPIPEGSSGTNAEKYSPVSQLPYPSHRESAIVSHLFLKTRRDSRSAAAAIDCMWGELQHHPDEPASLPLQGCAFWLQYKLKPLPLPQASCGTCELLHWKATSHLLLTSRGTRPETNF